MGDSEAIIETGDIDISHDGVLPRGRTVLTLNQWHDMRKDGFLTQIREEYELMGAGTGAFGGDWEDVAKTVTENLSHMSFDYLLDTLLRPLTSADRVNGTPPHPRHGFYPLYAIDTRNLTSLATERGLREYVLNENISLGHRCAQH